jgi:predicted alpha/beta superfamily hydrolase
LKAKLTIILTVFISTFLFGQKTDTIRFFSQAFQHDRTVYIQMPEFYQYQSDYVKLPVFYLLDGQNEWFINPLASTIKYLQYTHEIPQALLVIIPLVDRNVECSINSLQGDPSSLHKFITEELNERIQPYHPNEYKMIIGHSFSASFALYSYIKNPNFYSAVISNTPLDHFEELILEFEKNTETDNSKISISIGGIASDKDYYHRREFDRLKSKYPGFFKSINTFEADQSAHNAVPIVATPFLLTKIFGNFSSRYKKIAEVNDAYKLVTIPSSIEGEITKIERASTIGNYTYCPEIPDINGLASRYLASHLNEFGIAVYETGIKFFPKYYEFYLALYELYLPTDVEKSKVHLYTAAELLQSIETDSPERQEIINEINAEKKKNGWQQTDKSQ